MIEPPKSWSPRKNHVGGWMLYPDWFPQIFSQKFTSWHLFLANSPLCKWPQTNFIHPYDYPRFSSFVTYYLPLILQPGSFRDFDLGSFGWFHPGFSPDGLYAATWHPTVRAKKVLPMIMIINRSLALFCWSWILVFIYVLSIPIYDCFYVGSTFLVTPFWCDISLSIATIASNHQKKRYEQKQLSFFESKISLLLLEYFTLYPFFPSQKKRYPCLSTVYPRFF